MLLKAVIFDLDGVITDTSELHYLAWKRLADEEGLVFNRAVNERLRGVSRRDSLEIILDGWSPPAAVVEEMMERKNRYYVALLDSLSAANLLPGVLTLLDELRAAGILVALGSASRNAPAVLQSLAIADRFDVIADIATVDRSKPAPDLFLKAAELAGVSPAFCAVVEDAAAGVEAALSAGMWAVGIGPVERVGNAHAVFPSLEGVGLAQVQAALADAEWTVSQMGHDRAQPGHRETIFTTGNGYLCVRGALEEHVQGESPACFIHRLWDDMPVSFTELANLPSWHGVEVWVDDQPFSLEYGIVHWMRRTLDLRTGILSRMTRWQAAEGAPLVEIRFDRLCSMARAHVALVRVTVTLLEGSAQIRLRTGFDHHVENSGLLHWNHVAQAQDEESALLHVRTRTTGIELAQCAEVVARAPGEVRSAYSDARGMPAVEKRATLAQGQALSVEKFVALVSSNEDEAPVQAAANAAKQARDDGSERLLAENRTAWETLWQSADVIIDGDIEAQIAQRFNTYHLLIAAPAHTDRASIGAKTLSGLGYRHHVFWDTEIFILPLFTYTHPALARNMLMYRVHNLPGARAKAAENGYLGAQYPWESAGDGREVTPRWLTHFADPTRLVRIWTGDIEIHITADVAYAILQHWAATGDDAWMAESGAEVVLDGANFWASAAQLEADGLYHFRNVIGPDEYHDRIDDNAYTNRFAQYHLRTALQIVDWLAETNPAKHAHWVEKLGLSRERLEQWRTVAEAMFVGRSTPSGVIEQFEGYFERIDADIAALRDPARTRSMQAILDIEPCAETQILKQPDVLMLQYLLPELFSPQEVAANYAYYDPRTDHEHGSSLGPSISAIMACRVGDAEGAYAHYMRAARADLRDVRHNAGDGIHAASAGGLWQAVVFGFAGLQINGKSWQVNPRLPQHWTRVAFKFWLHGTLQEVEIQNPQAQPNEAGDMVTQR